MLGRDALITASALHDSSFVFPDGVKGQEVYFNADGIVTPVSPPFTTRTKQNFYVLNCFYGEMYLARAVASVGHLAKNGNYIYTTTLRVIDVVRSNIGRQSDDPVEIVQLGGDVVDQGESLRDVYNRIEPYEPGQQYLLVLERTMEGSEGVASVVRHVDVSGPDETLTVGKVGSTGCLFGVEIRPDLFGVSQQTRRRCGA